MREENIGFGNLKLLQKPEEFCYGVDAVILADFAASLGGGFKNAADLGTGTGIIPFVLSHKAQNQGSKIIGIDIQRSYVEMASESCRMNGLENRITFIHADAADISAAGNLYDISEEEAWKEVLDEGGFDVVVSNPPYVSKGSGIINGNEAKFIARQETTADLEGFVKSAARLLSSRGQLFMVHRPSRLVDIFYYCRKHGLEPKTIRFVAPKQNETPNIVLVHCRKQAGKELKYMKTLNVYGEDGNYSSEIEHIYERA